MKMAIMALLGLVLAACAPTAGGGPGSGSAPGEGGDPGPIPSAGDATITLQRGVCFGFCPDYTVTIAGDGSVTYVGRRFVNVTGEQHAAVERAAVERLLGEFDRMHFNALRDEYRAQVTDLPTYSVTLTRNGQSKTVRDYGGLSAGMPQAVRDLQQEIDRVAGTARWVLRDGEPVRGGQEH